MYAFISLIILCVRKTELIFIICVYLVYGELIDSYYCHRRLFVSMPLLHGCNKQSSIKVKKINANQPN